MEAPVATAPAPVPPVPSESDAMMKAQLAALEQQLATGGGVPGDDILDVDLEGVTPRMVPLERGWYPMEIVGVQKQTAKTEAKTPMLLLDLVVFRGPGKNRHVWDRVMIGGDPKAKQRFALLIDALGMYDATAKRFTGKVSDFSGKQLWVMLEIDEERVDDGSRDPARKGKVYPARNYPEPWNGFKPINMYALPADTNEIVVPDVMTDPFSTDAAAVLAQAPTNGAAVPEATAVPTPAPEPAPVIATPVVEPVAVAPAVPPPAPAPVAVAPAPAPVEETIEVPTPADTAPASPQTPTEAPASATTEVAAVQPVSQPTPVPEVSTPAPAPSAPPVPEPVPIATEQVQAASPPPAPAPAPVAEATPEVAAPGTPAPF